MIFFQIDKPFKAQIITPFTPYIINNDKRFDLQKINLLKANKMRLIVNRQNMNLAILWRLIFQLIGRAKVRERQDVEIVVVLLWHILLIGADVWEWKNMEIVALWLFLAQWIGICNKSNDQ